jgi:hypothetical protein
VTLSPKTIKATKWLADLCKNCPPGMSLKAEIMKHDCEHLAETLDYVLVQSANAKRTKKTPTKDKP